MTRNATGRCLLDMPYEVVFEIFRRLPKGKLIEVSKLSPKFKDIAGNKRFWKDVYIKYEPNTPGLKNGIFAYEELYSEPWPVKAIDLEYTKIKSPVTLKIDPIVKVTRLNLFSVKAFRSVIKALLAKYQCTELYLEFEQIDDGEVLGVAPAALSQQTALEVLWLRAKKYNTKIESTCSPTPYLHDWLAVVLSQHCKNLKTLELSHMDLRNFDLLFFVEFLPKSLEKLLILAFASCAEERFFVMLAERCPNLRELQLCPPSVKFSSLLEFQFLETLRIFPCNIQSIDTIIDERILLENLGIDFVLSGLYKHLLKFPALKAIYLSQCTFRPFEETDVEWLRSMLKPHGVIVDTNGRRLTLPPKDDNLWEVSKTL